MLKVGTAQNRPTSAAVTTRWQTSPFTICMLILLVEKPAESTPLRPHGVRNLSKLELGRRASSSFRGNAVVGRHDLPFAADSHPDIGQTVMIFIGFAVGFTPLVIGARHNGSVAMHPN